MAYLSWGIWAVLKVYPYLALSFAVLTCWLVFLDEPQPHVVSQVSSSISCCSWLSSLGGHWIYFIISPCLGLSVDPNNNPAVSPGILGLCPGCGSDCPACVTPGFQLILSLGATLLLLTLGIFPPSKTFSFKLRTEHLRTAFTESNVLG